jgi:hypothetical protein
MCGSEGASLSDDSSLFAKEGGTFLNSRMRSTERATEQFINDAERR